MDLTTLAIAKKFNNNNSSGGNSSVQPLFAEFNNNNARSFQGYSQYWKFPYTFNEIVNAINLGIPVILKVNVKLSEYSSVLFNININYIRFNESYYEGEWNDTGIYTNINDPDFMLINSYIQNINNAESGWEEWQFEDQFASSPEDVFNRYPSFSVLYWLNSFLKRF